MDESGRPQKQTSCVMFPQLYASTALYSHSSMFPQLLPVSGKMELPQLYDIPTKHVELKNSGDVYVPTALYSHNCQSGNIELQQLYDIPTIVGTYRAEKLWGPQLYILKVELWEHRADPRSVDVLSAGWRRHAMEGLNIANV